MRSESIKRNMPILFKKFITRKEVQDNCGLAWYVFGDNVEGKGLGGQAKEMRGESNSIGIPTKFAPGTNTRDYFYDSLYIKVIFQYFSSPLIRIENILSWDDGGIIVWPADGLGTNRAELKTRAPKLKLFLDDALEYFVSEYGTIDELPSS